MTSSMRTGVCSRSPPKTRTNRTASRSGRRFTRPGRSPSRGPDRREELRERRKKLISEMRAALTSPCQQRSQKKRPQTVLEFQERALSPFGTEPFLHLMLSVDTQEFQEQHQPNICSNVADSIWTAIISMDQDNPLTIEGKYISYQPYLLH